MVHVERVVALIIAIVILPGEWMADLVMRIAGKKPARALLAAAILVLATRGLVAQTDCLSCHGDKTMQDANGHSIAVDGKTFSASIHGSLQCNDCHADIKEYPHPDHVEPVECKTCHADQAAKPGRKRACGRQGPPLHELPRRCAHDFSQGRFAVGGLSAECSADLRELPRHRWHGEEAWAARASIRITWIRFTDSR